MQDEKKQLEKLKKRREFEKIDELINKAMPKFMNNDNYTLLATFKELQIGFFNLFRFSSSEDRMMMFIGSLAAVINGACIPMFGLLYGEVRDAIMDSITSSKSPSKQISDVSGYFIILGGICFFTGYLQQYCWNVAGTTQSITIRKEYYNSLFRQDMSWFQREDKLKLSNRIQSELYFITDGIADKVGLLIMAISMGVSGLLQSFFTHISMSLILVLSIPIMAYPFYYYERTQKQMDKQKQEQYQSAGKMFDLTVSQIKSVKSFNKQDTIFFKYEKLIEEVKNRSIAYGLKLGLSLGTTVLTLALQNALCFYVGSLMLEYNMNNSLFERATNLSDIVVVFIGLLIASLVLGQINPFINMITKAREAGGKVFSTIDAQQTINPQDNLGKQLGNMQGNIKFENVTFKYVVNRQQYTCLDNVSFEIQPGQKVSIIGQSGSGKSSILNLIMRFYDPQEGQVFLDGEHISHLNVKSFRSQIGYVGQEPEVFYGSIRENLQIGKSDATLEELHEIVESLDKQIDADVKNLSSGEKQRLCFARVLLKKPKIFIFDEPTSSQDYRMERKIQKLIDEITKGITTIVVSHSFGNIQKSDQIIIMNKGKILKQGKHADLIKEEGIYLNILEEHNYIDEKLKVYMNDKVEEQITKEQGNGEADQSNEELQSKKYFESCFGQQELNEQQKAKQEEEENLNKLQLLKVEKQQSKIDDLKKKIKEKMDEQFLTLDFKYQNLNIPQEKFLFNFSTHKTLKQYLKSMHKQRSNLQNNNNNNNNTPTLNSKIQNQNNNQNINLNQNTLNDQNVSFNNQNNSNHNNKINNKDENNQNKNTITNKNINNNNQDNLTNNNNNIKTEILKQQDQFSKRRKNSDMFLSQRKIDTPTVLLQQQQQNKTQLNENQIELQSFNNNNKNNNNSQIKSENIITNNKLTSQNLFNYDKQSTTNHTNTTVNPNQRESIRTLFYKSSSSNITENIKKYNYHPEQDEQQSNNEKEQQIYKFSDEETFKQSEEITKNNHDNKEDNINNDNKQNTNQANKQSQQIQSYDIKQYQSQEFYKNLKSVISKNEQSNNNTPTTLDQQNNNIPKTNESTSNNNKNENKEQKQVSKNKKVKSKNKKNDKKEQVKSNQILINYQHELDYKKMKKSLRSMLFEKGGYKHYFWYIAGIITCAVNGAIYPVNSIVIADTILSISNFSIDPTYHNKRQIMESLYNFFYCGLTGFLSSTLMVYAFTIAGETLALNLKKMIFYKILHLPIQWFLKKENKLGVLSEIQNVDTYKLSNILSNICSILTAMLVSFYFNYRLAFVIAVLFPIVLLAGFFIKKNSYSARYEKELTDHKANEFIQDVIMNHKTLASLVDAHEYLQKQYYALYSSQLQNLKLKAKKQAFFYGLAMFIIVSSQSWFFFIVSRIDFDKYDIRDLFVCILSILFAIFSIMENLRYVSDLGSAMSSRKRIIYLLFKNKSEIELHEEIKLLYEREQEEQQKQQQQKQKQNQNQIIHSPSINTNQNLSQIRSSQQQQSQIQQQQQNQQQLLQQQQQQQSQYQSSSMQQRTYIIDESTKNNTQNQQKSVSENKNDISHQNMMSLNNSIQEQRIYIDEIIQDQDQQEEIEQKPIVEFKSVYFKYPHRENYSLYDVSFQIKKGDKICLIGSSGSGKSTIFNLLLGFFENYQGTILLNGQDLRLMELNEIRSYCRWAQQEPFIIQESLQENIIFGSNQEKFNFKRYKQSIATACGEDILMKMKDQYNTDIAFLKQQQQLQQELLQQKEQSQQQTKFNVNSSRDKINRRVSTITINNNNNNNTNNNMNKKSNNILMNGNIMNEEDRMINDANAMKKKQQDEFIEQTMSYKLQELSGGQKQKICLARAIYGKGNIYLFDNCTSSLDLKTEKQVFAHLKSKYFNRKTFFQIAQRLEPIFFSNKLMIINSGRLVEFKTICQGGQQNKKEANE